MQGYSVVTNDGSKVGHVVDELGDFLIVESGHLRKSKHPIPKVFATVREDEEVVCVTVTKDVIDDAPSINGGEPDEEEILRHYGLAGGFETADTEGYGETTRDDPAYGDDGMVAAEQGRVALREGRAPDTDVPTVRGRSPNALNPGEIATDD
jgi:hypothetical protein